MSGRSKPDFEHDEILYVSNFEQVHREPSFVARRCREDVGDLKFLSIPVTNLLHITHKEEADKITEESSFKFKAFAKVGRSGFGSWKKKPGNARWYEIAGKAFPGYLSWWSVSLSGTEGGGSTIRANIKREIDDLGSNGLKVCVSDYLKPHPESIYGGYAFECNFMDLLNSYAKSRSPGDRPISDICIRVGGTLTYKLEICYVLLVCFIDDSALFEYSKLTNSELFSRNRLLDEEGRIDPRARTFLTFHPKQNVSWFAIGRGSGEGCSYETAAFAFYFQENGQALTVDSPCCIKQPISHNGERCIKNKKGTIRCPDKE